MTINALKNLHFDNTFRDIHTSYEENGYSHDLDWSIICTNCVFHFLRDVGAELKMSL